MKVPILPLLQRVAKYDRLLRRGTTADALAAAGRVCRRQVFRDLAWMRAELKSPLPLNAGLKYAERFNCGRAVLDWLGFG